MFSIKGTFSKAYVLSLKNANFDFEKKVRPCLVNHPASGAILLRYGSRDYLEIARNSYTVNNAALNNFISSNVWKNCSFLTSYCHCQKYAEDE